MTQPPVFHIASHSHFGRPWAWITDPVGTTSLRAGRQPSVLPIIHVNVTSAYALSQVLVPPTYHGSLDLSSHFATVTRVDHAKDLLGRNTVWYDESDRAQRGDVYWDARYDGEEVSGSVNIATQYAVARVLLLGVDDDGIDHWPNE